MEIWELDYLVKTYNTKAFNIHPLSEFSLKYNLDKYSNCIYIENTYAKYNEQEIKKFAGTCNESHSSFSRISDIGYCFHVCHCYL